LSKGDSLTGHRREKFSTRDQDNDRRGSSCAVDYKGAWWYHSCYQSNLNGEYGQHVFRGVIWADWLGNDYSLRFTEMKIRPFNLWTE